MRPSLARPARVFLTALTAVAFGCTAETSSSIDGVVTEMEPGLGRRLDLVRITFTRLATGDTRVIERTPSYERERFAPISVRLSPGAGDSPGELYRIRAEGLVGTDAIVAAQHRIAFVSGRIVLPLRFWPRCIAVGCGQDTTCEDGRCVSDLGAACAMDAGVVLDLCERADAGMGDGSDGGGPDGGPLPPPPPGPDAVVPCTGCDDGLACTDDRCLAEGACAHVVEDARCGAGELCLPPAGCRRVGCATDVECDDGDGCTTDRCVGGSCARSAVRCSALGPCTSTTCDPTIGRCVSMPLPDGTSCGGGLCCGAVCIEPTRTDFACGGCGTVCALGTSCIDSSCRACSLASECDDGLACTADSCAAGRCVRTPVDGCLIGGACVAAGERDPTDACRACAPAMRTDAWTAMPGGTPCDDGQACTEGDRCSEGRCIPGTPVDCSDAEICTEDACSEPSGACTHTVVRSHCVIDGACHGEAQSAPGDSCLVCDPAIDARTWTRRSPCE